MTEAEAYDERHRVAIARQLDEFPPELRRCTCGTPSFNRHDHSSVCPLGPTPPLSSNPDYWPPTRRLPEDMF